MRRSDNNRECNNPWTQSLACSCLAGEENQATHQRVLQHFSFSGIEGSSLNVQHHRTE